MASRLEDRIKITAFRRLTDRNYIATVEIFEGIIYVVLPNLLWVNFPDFDLQHQITVARFKFRRYLMETEERRTKIQSKVQSEIWQLID
ncbi:MAG: hypothetical protein ACOYB2_19680 [Limnohabitans sp.]